MSRVEGHGNLCPKRVRDSAPPLKSIHLPSSPHLFARRAGGRKDAATHSRPCCVVRHRRSAQHVARHGNKKPLVIRVWHASATKSAGYTGAQSCHSNRVLDLSQTAANGLAFHLRPPTLHATILRGLCTAELSARPPPQVQGANNDVVKKFTQI